MTDPHAAAPAHIWIVLAVAVVAISTAAVIVGGLPGTHPMAIAAWRTTFVAILLSPWIRLPRTSDLLKIGFAGMFLAIHFSTWFASLHLTTVLRSTVLVCLAPLWIGLAESIWTRRVPPLLWWVGMALAIPCAALLTSEPDQSATLAGDALALVGGLCGAAYFLLGRSVRARVGIGTYGSLVCAAAALCLLPACAVIGAPLIGFSPYAWLAILALALGPQLLGHNGFNYALRFLPASTVTAASLLEPLGAGLLAWWLLGQSLTPLAVAAGVGSVVGVGVATLAATRPSPHAKMQLDP